VGIALDVKLLINVHI